MAKVEGKEDRTGPEVVDLLRAKKIHSLLFFNYFIVSLF
jgi:hypothetical protein